MMSTKLLVLLLPLVSPQRGSQNIVDLVDVKATSRLLPSLPVTAPLLPGTSNTSMTTDSMAADTPESQETTAEVAGGSCPGQFVCQDDVTCLDLQKVCDGIRDCPRHETGTGGEEEEGCQEAGSGEGGEEDEEELTTADEEELTPSLPSPFTPTEEEGQSIRDLVDIKTPRQTTTSADSGNETEEEGPTIRPPTPTSPIPPATAQDPAPTSPLTPIIGEGAPIKDIVDIKITDEEVSFVTTPTIFPTLAPNSTPALDSVTTPTSEERPNIKDIVDIKITGTSTLDTTQGPTQSPTQASTQAPTKFPTETSTLDATQATTEAPTETSTLDTTQAPTQPPTKAPTQSPSEPSTQSPSGAPTQAPSETPTQAPNLPVEEPDLTSPPADSTLPPVCDFQCQEGACLSSSQRCDGYDDCPRGETGTGGEDEEGCPGSGNGEDGEETTTQAPTQAPSESPTQAPNLPVEEPDLISPPADSTLPPVCDFQCQEGACLSSSQRCDGYDDCPRGETGTGGEDEEGCAASGNGEDGEETTTQASSQAPTIPPTLPSTTYAAPTDAPTEAPTEAPTTAPTETTKAPTAAPTEPPTEAPTEAPTVAPTEAPTEAPTKAPIETTEAPTEAPTQAPAVAPTENTEALTAAPTEAPTEAPTQAPTAAPIETTEGPTEAPTEAPTQAATILPTPTPTTPTTATTTPAPTPPRIDHVSLCASVLLDPRRYLVPHPTDCTKFFSCQHLGKGRFLAHLQLCPATTEFASSQMICNFSTPACRRMSSEARKEMGRRQGDARRQGAGRRPGAGKTQASKNSHRRRKQLPHRVRNRNKSLVKKREKKRRS